MPQMAPIWWTTLFSMFVSCLALTIMVTYFFNIYSTSKMNVKKSKSNEFNWKW